MRFSKHWKILLLLPFFASAQDLGMEIEGFRVPEYDEQGVMTSQLFGDRAEIGANGEIKITGLRIEFYEDEETFMEVRSPYCFYNRQTKQAHSDAAVSADMEGVQVRGTGFDLDSEERTVRVLADSRVTIADVMERVEADDLPTRDAGESTVITADQMMLEYKARTVRFEENVHIVDPVLTMDCDKLSVQFSESNEIDWIEALSGVTLIHEGRKALAGKAVYDIQADEIVLEDNPRLVDGRNVLSADRIHFWRSERRMVCEPSPRLILYPDDEFETELFKTR